MSTPKCPFAAQAHSSASPAEVPAVDPRPLPQRLKEDNWDLHEQAEHDRLPQAMVKGELSREGYVELLGQMWLVNRELDAAITNARLTHPFLGEFVSDRQLQEPYLRADLEHHGVDLDAIEPTPGASALIEHAHRLAQHDVHALFGLHYVREGANNGNKFVAMKLKKAYGVEDQPGPVPGFTYLNPYGEDQRPLWDAWKTKLGTHDFTEPEMASIVAGARSMFEHIIALHKDLDRLVPATA